jgi:hypothetical protein
MRFTRKQSMFLERLQVLASLHNTVQIVVLIRGKFTSVRLHF